ncbi:MAG: hypothetical protein O3A87_04865 [Verrucomicrobia bacterium]|nr:hypothetical protein [Verrucomicrobiota bacterium]MDA1005799.1 hypothetical protein [Verrucomicrobiota bacterium]
MKFAGTIVIILGIAVGAVQVPLLTSSFSERSGYVYFGIPLAMILLGAWLCRTKVDRKRTAKWDSGMQAAYLLFVAIPVGTFAMVLIPTFIASRFLPPGRAEWVAYGLAAVIVPVLLVLWWVRVRMVFSTSYRGVVFASAADAERFSGCRPLGRLAGGRAMKTSERREGTTKAKAKMHAGNAFYTIQALLFSLLAQIPLVGLLFSPLKLLVFEAGGRRMDQLKEKVDRLEAPTLEELTAADSRQPVLLLRSFLDDCLQMESLEAERKNSNTVTYEELICREASEWGPVVAIGDPKDEMPPLGAARAYYTHETWQEHAINLLNRSRVVVLIMGRTPSVGWELERILKEGHAGKTIVMMPPADELGYEERLLRLDEISMRITGTRLDLDLPKGHQLLALAFTKGGAVKPVSGPMNVSLAYSDALLMASRVVGAEVN